MPARTCPWARQIATVRSRNSSRSTFRIGYAAVRNSGLLGASRKLAPVKTLARGDGLGPARRHFRTPNPRRRREVRAEYPKSWRTTSSSDRRGKRSALTHMASLPSTSHSHSGGPARGAPRRQDGMDGGEGGHSPLSGVCECLGGLDQLTLDLV